MTEPQNNVEAKSASNCNTGTCNANTHNTTKTPYSSLTREELNAEHEKLKREYNEFCARGLALNMARGKPSPEQLRLSLPMFDMFNSSSNYTADDGTDCLNYGVLTGIPEAKRMMSWLLDEPTTDNIIVGGNSSLSLIFDAMGRAFNHGLLGTRPWREYERIKWICLVPGYDRHFAILEHYGIEPVCINLREDGPDMDEVERIVAEDDVVKGIFCVPKYSNPSGITYSDDVVQRLATMECAANDFQIFWDMAYCVHHLNESESEQDQLFDIASACREAGNPHRYIKFASTSKITFAGSGVSGLAASPEVLKEATDVMQIEMIGYNKINQLMHARFLKSKETLREHMIKHARILKPKFDLVERKLKEQLGSGAQSANSTDGTRDSADKTQGANVAQSANAPANDVQNLSPAFGTWTNPRGGYFITYWAPQGCARRIVQLAKNAGMVLTGAGCTWPEGKDPNDSDIRIAPSLPPLEELDTAMDLFCCCVKLATIEKEIAQ